MTRIMDEGIDVLAGLSRQKGGMMSLPTTTRVAWAADLFEDVDEFLRAQQAGEADGLILLQDPETGDWYLDEGDCEGPFAGDEETRG